METIKESTVYFDEFVLDPARRLLQKNNQTINLNSKTLDLLLALIEKSGEIVTKDELLDTVWANQFVEENNLTVHIAALRKALGEKKGEHRFIVTVPGKGYVFVAEIERKSLDQTENTAISVRENQPPDFSVSAKLSKRESLIGREREIAEIKDLLQTNDINLITLTGTGGTGKTSLARAIGFELFDNFADGVFFTELASIANAELLFPAIVQSVGAEEFNKNTPLESLKTFFEERRVLLILDNFEQIASAAPLLQELLDSSDHLKILVTSRIPLRLKNETEYRVAPLAVPEKSASSVDELTEFPAIDLFLVRARNARPNFVLTPKNAPPIAAICQKLDGLPLAIELAAARIKVLSPPEILKRLENSLDLLTGGATDLPERHQTMRATVKWSYDLLDDVEKTIFRRLAVFSGGFTIDSAEAVTGKSWRKGEREKGRKGEGDLSVLNDFEEINKNEHENFTGQNLSPSPHLPISPSPHLPFSPSVLDGIVSLLDKALLTAKEMACGGVRLGMLEVVREFALECLEESGESETLRQNHARYFLVLAEESEPNLLSEQSVETMEKLESEHNNIRAALHWSLVKDAETAARLTAALRYFWLNRSHISEGRNWMEAALNKSKEISSTVRTKLLNGFGQFTRNQGDYETAQKVYREGLAVAVEAEDWQQIANSKFGLATLATRQGDFANAQVLTEEVLEISRRIGDESIMCFALAALADLELARGETAAARPLIEQSLVISENLGNKLVSSVNLTNLGIVSFSEKNYNAAQTQFVESLKIAHELGNKSVVSCALDGLAALFEKSGNAEKSAQLAGAAESLRESIGYEIERTERRFRDIFIAETRTTLGENLFNREFEKGRAMPLSEALALADSLPEDENQTDEIIIETHKFERITIEEEIIPEPQEKTLKLNRKQGISAGFTYALIIGFIFVALFVFWFWII